MIKHLLLAIFTLCLHTTMQAQCPTAPSVGCNGVGTSLDLYWVGTTANNSGNWNTPCSWRVGSTTGVEPCQEPRSIDNVFFTNASFASTLGTGATITINTIALCNNFYVDPNVSALTGTPTFSLNNPGFMEVYGNFTLQNKVTWTIVGGGSVGPETFFKATTLGKTIKTNGKLLGDVVFNGVGGGWSLQDNLNANTVCIIYGNFNTSDGVNAYTMNLQNFSLSSGTAGITAANRIIKFNNSVVNISAVNANRYSALNFSWEAGGCTAANTNFICGGSLINFNLLALSKTITLGALTYNVINHTGTGNIFDYNGSGTAIIDTLKSSGSIGNSHSENINVLWLTGIAQTHTFNSAVTVNNDFRATASLCNPTGFRTGGATGTTFAIPASVTADPMVGYRMTNIKTSPTHAYTGWKQGTTTGWVVTAPTSRDLYWVGTTSTLWSNPLNWSASATGSPVLAATDCPPTLSDDIYFTAALLDAVARPCSVNIVATCHNITWTTATANAKITGASNISISGNLTFVPSMVFTNTSTWYMVGNTNNTVFSAGKLYTAIQFTDFSTYSLLDDLNFGTQTLYQISSFNSNTFKLNGGQLNFTNNASSQVNFSGSIITLSSSVPWLDQFPQSNVVYNALSKVIFTYAGATTSIAGGSTTGSTLYLPELLVQSPLTTLRAITSLCNLYIKGNLTINGNAGFYGNTTGGPGTKFYNVTVAGNLNLAAGKIYEFGLEPLNMLTVNGTVNSIGTCSASITIKGINGNAFKANFLSTTNFDFTNIANATATTPITVTNCVDNGGNTNWTFNPPATTYTYYWRASASGTCSPCVYNGNWSTGDNWSTNPLAIQGTAGCMPSQYDNVVFDNMSWNGTTTNVTVASNVSFNNITAIATKATIVGTTGSITCAGNVASDGTLVFTTFTGPFIFAATTTGKTINFGGVALAGDIVFNNANGGYTVVNSFLRTSTDVYLNAGTLNTNGRLFGMRRFKSSGTAVRALNLGTSTMTINGSGDGSAPVSAGGAVYSWDTQVATNFTLNAGTSTVSIDGNGNTPIVKGNNLTFYNFNCTGANSALATCPQLQIDGWNTKYMKLSGSAIMYGNNAFDTLEFTAGKVYKLENNKTQTLKAPNGILMATGTPGNFIAIKGTTVGGIPAQFRKLNTAGALTYMCFDYLSIEDNLASSDDAGFKFYTGVNSNNISATGIWDLSLALFYTPTITAAPDLNVCPGGLGDITFNLAGSGPFIIKYSIGGGAPITINKPFGTTSFTLTNISHYTTTAYTITSFKAQTCAGLIGGTVVDGTLIYNTTPAEVISLHNDVATCNLNNENQFVHFYKDIVPRRPLISIADDATGTGLGNTSATVQIDAMVQTLGSGQFVVPYLQRRFGITPTSPQLSTIRLYFTQTELNALSAKNIAMGRPALTIADLMVTKFNNNVMDFTGGATLLTVTNRGAIPAGITTTSNVFFVEVMVSSYSHFIIHPPTTSPLPIELISFTSKCSSNNVISLNWNTATENNNAYFNIEKSSNATTWETITKIKGAGNSNKQLQYIFNDKNPANKEQYYRLKQTDFDGKYTYSDMINVNCSNAKNIISVFPNPNNGSFTINTSIANCTYELYNSEGKLMENKLLDKGQNFVSVNQNPSAIYFIIIKNATEILYKDILIIEQ
jgi:hypothetical protein